MASNRIGRINEEIQRELSSLFRTLKDPRVQGGMVTITHVDTTTDLRYCRVFVSVLDKTQEKDVIRGLKSAAGYLRRELGMAMSLRYTPELQFIADDSIEYGAHILEMLLDPRVVALEHRLIDAQGEVGLGLGSEPNQICAVAHPNRIDHYVAEMLRPEAYGRYMDDFYLTHESKEYLQVCLLLIEHECAKLGIALNPRKTRVVKLTRGFTWLKKRIFYTETGRIVMKPCRDSITRERRKLKKMARMVAEGVMTPEQVQQSYQSWRGGMAHLDAHRSVLAMDALYRSLFENLAGGLLNAIKPERRFGRNALAIAEGRQLKTAA